MQLLACPAKFEVVSDHTPGAGGTCGCSEEFEGGKCLLIETSTMGPAGCLLDQGCLQLDHEKGKDDHLHHNVLHSGPPSGSIEGSTVYSTATGLSESVSRGRV